MFTQHFQNVQNVLNKAQVLQRLSVMVRNAISVYGLKIDGEQ